MSTTIDERVVEMRFDNKQFESNVKTSMSTLDKLKSKLKLTDSIKGFENIEKATKEISFDKLMSSVEKLEQRFSTIGIVGMRAIENVTDSMMNLSKRTLSFLKNGVVNGGITRAMNLENAHFQLQGLLKDEKAVTAVMKNVNDSVDGTAYSLDAAAKVASQLAASGMKAGNEMFTSLRAVAGVAAMTNSEYDSIGQIFTTVAGNGRLMGDQLLQLSSRGMNAAATLADYLTKTGKGAKVTEAQVRQMVTEGQISFKLFASAMDDAFGKHAKKANETFTGAMSNVKSALARIGAEFISPLVEQKSVLVKFFNTLRERINDVKNSIGPLANLFVDSVKAMGRSANRFFKNLDVSQTFNKFKAFNSSWERISKRITDAGLSADIFQKRLAKVAKQHGIHINKMIKQEGSLDKVIQNGDIPKKLLIKTLNKYAEANEKASSKTKKTAKHIGVLVTRAKEAGTPLNNLFNTLERPSGRNLFINSFKNALKGLSKIIATVKNAWSEVFPKTTSTQLYNILECVNKFSERLIITDETAEKLKNTFKGVFAIFDIFKTVISSLLSTAFAPFSNIVGKANTGILDITSSVSNAIVQFDNWLKENEVFVNIFKGIGNVISTAASRVEAFLSLFKEMNITKGFGLIFDGLVKNISDFADHVKSLNNLTLDDVIALIKNFKNNTFEYFSNISDKIIGIKKNIKEFAEDSINHFSKTGSNVEDFTKKVINAVNAVKNFIGGHIGEILTTGFGVGFIVSVLKISKALESFGNPLVKIGDGVTNVLDNCAKTVKAFSSQIKSQAILNIAKSIAVLVGSVALLGSLKQNQLQSGLISLALLSSLLLVLTKAMDTITGKTDFKGMLGIAAIIIGLSTSIKAMGKSLEMMASLDYGRMWADLGVIAGIGLVLTGLVKILSKSAPQLSKSTLSFVGIVISLKLLIGVFSDLDKINIKNPDKVIVGMIGIIASFAGLMAVVRIAGKNLSRIGGSVLAMSASLFVIIAAIKRLNKFEPSELSKAIDTISQLLTVFGFVTALSLLAGKNAAKAGAMCLTMSGAIVILTGVMVVLSHMDPDGLSQALKAITKLELVLGVLIAATYLAKDCKGSLTMLAVIIGELAVVTGLFSMMNKQNLTTATASLSAIIATFSLLIAATSLLGKNDSLFGKSLSTLTVLTGIVTILAGVLIGISSVPIGSTLEIATSLSELIVALSASMVILGKVEDISGNALGSIGILTAVVAGLGVAIGIVSLFNVGNALEIASSLSELLLALSASMVVLDKVGKISGNALGSMGILTAVVAGLGVAIGIVSLFNVKNTLEIATSLSELLLALSASLVIVSAAGKLKEGVFIGIAGLLVLIAGVGAFVAGIGALMKQFPQLEEFLNTGLPLLEQIGTAIGNFFGGIAGGFMESLEKGIASGLPAIGTALSDFMTNASGFIEGSKNIDSNAMNGIKSLAEAFAFLVGADFLNSITSLFGGDASLSEFSAQLPDFGEKLVEFSNSIDGLDAKSVDEAASAGKMLVEMASAIPNTGGLLGKIVGNNDMDDFGERLCSFGEALKDFSGAVAGNIDTEAVSTAATAGKIIAEMASELPNTGGLLGDLLGDNDMDVFGRQLVVFGSTIKTFSSTVDKNVDVQAVSTAAKAGRIIAEMASELPNTGGLFGDLVGDNDMDVFGRQLVVFGSTIKTFSKTVAGNVNVQAIYTAATAGKIIAEMASKLPNTGGLVGFFTGDNDMDDFGKQLVKFGSSMVDFSETVSGISNVDNIVTLSSSLSSLLKFLKDSLSINTSTVSNFGNTLSDIARNGISKFTGAISGSKQMMIDAVNGALAKVIETLENWNLELENKAYNSGQYVADGFSKGIKSRSNKVDDATSKMAKKAVNTTNKELEINSPSKKFARIGKYVVEGLGKGISDNTSKLKDPVKKLTKALGGNTKKDSMSKYLKNFTKNIGNTKDLKKNMSDVTKAFSNTKGFETSGKQSIDGFVKGINSKDMTKIGKVSSSNFNTGFATGLNNTKKIVKANLEYGKGAIKQFCKQYISSTDDKLINTIGNNAASLAITNYGKQLYKESDYYKDDKQNLKSYKTELDSLQKKRKELQNQLEKNQKKNSKNSKSRINTLKNELKENEKDIKEAKKKIKNHADDVAAHTKQVFKELRSSLSESFKSFLDPLSLSMDNGIDLFSKYENDAASLDEANKKLADENANLDTLNNKRTELLNKINSASLSNDLASRLEIKQLKEELSEVESDIEDSKNNIESIESDIESYSSITANTILENMQSQVDGISKAQSNMQALAGKGLSQGLISYLKEKGTEAAGYVEQFLKMTPDQIAKANELYGQTQKLSADTLLINFKDQYNKALNWVNGINQLSQKGFNQNVIEQLGNMGVESGYEYLQTFLAMTPEQIEQFNSDCATAVSFPDKAANSVIASYAYAGAQSIDGFIAAISKLAEDGSDQNVSLNAQGKAIGNVLGNALKNTTKPIGKKVAKNIIKGITKGLGGKGKEQTVEQSKKLAQAIYDAAAEVLGIKSPSKEFAKIGEYIDAGFVKGMATGEKDIYNSVTGIMGNAINKVSEFIDGDFDAQPTITPVMDLTNIQNGFNSIGKMTDGYSFSGSVDFANSVANDMNGYMFRSDGQLLNAMNKLQGTLSSLMDRPSIEQHNSFNISGNNPREIASEVSHILQQQIERRNATWA